MVSDNFIALKGDRHYCVIDLVYGTISSSSSPTPRVDIKRQGVYFIYCNSEANTPYAQSVSSGKGHFTQTRAFHNTENINREDKLRLYSGFASYEKICSDIYTVYMMNDNYCFVIYRYFFIVYDPKTWKSLYCRHTLGGYKKSNRIESREEYTYTIKDIIKLNETSVLIKEKETYFKERGHVYIYDVPNQTVLQKIQPYEINYYCDIFKELSKNRVALRFLTDWLEIWDLEVIQCQVKISVFEVERIEEISNNRIIAYSDHGIQIIHLK